MANGTRSTVRFRRQAEQGVWGLLIHGIFPVIPPRSNRSQPIACNVLRHRDRTRIERMLNRLKPFRRIATRYDKTAKSFPGFLNPAATKRRLQGFGR